MFENYLGGIKVMESNRSAKERIEVEKLVALDSVHKI
jgi:hypothetical protein